MSGHSKWSNIKRRKGAQDAVRGKIFTKLIKEIMVAAKMGGADLEANSRLRLAVDKAKSNSMPRANIDRAIAKAAGDLKGDDYHELVYEGYGPGGVAILVECLTDNRNRTSSDVRHAFTKHGGNLGASGSVSYLFQQKGFFTIEQNLIDEDSLLLVALDGGAEDVSDENDMWIITCEREDYDSCKKALQSLEVATSTAELTRLPDNTVELSEADEGKLLRMMEHLEDLDDVQETYTNAG
ncbi:MAG: YebC/PmpR family DNA-binding transcriptional regulator [Proteobacteria bacterium]|jgi:YebC/PmpR family DNA-binding regulatory protein|nr:YebC/PmpR family DNA-binding transcriptional regulator [Pseudomonadota bacterium]